MPKKFKPKHRIATARPRIMVHAPMHHKPKTVSHTPKETSTPTTLFGKAHAWAKKTRAISKVLSMVSHIDPKFAIAHAVAAKHGYGRFRRRRIMGGSQRRGTNSLTQNTRFVAMRTEPFEIPKLSLQLRRYNNSLGLGGNYR
jgi:hypothetical protein